MRILECWNYINDENWYDLVALANLSSGCQCSIDASETLIRLNPQGTNPEMSWQEYIDNNLVGSGHVSRAAIVGHNGDVWATSPGLDVSSNSSEFNGWFPMAPTPIRVAGVDYLRLKTDDRSVYGKKGNGGCALVKTGQCIIVAIYDAGIQPGQATSTTEKLADYLIDNGY